MDRSSPEENTKLPTSSSIIQNKTTGILEKIGAKELDKYILNFFTILLFLNKPTSFR
jgi:hypothetical protein